VQKCVGEGLGLPNDPGAYAVFREHLSGLQYIRNCRELWERGIYAELGAYKCQVYIEFSIVFDDAQGRWSGLAAELSGRGVPRIDDALRERELRPVRNPFAALLGLDVGSVDSKRLLQKFEQFLRPAAQRAQGRVNESACMADFQNRLIRLTELARLFGPGGTAPAVVPPGGTAPAVVPPGGAASAVVPPGGTAPAVVPPGGAASAVARAFLWPWTILRPLCGSEPLPSPALSWIHEWMLAPILLDHLLRAGWDEQSAGTFSSLFEIALRTENLVANPRAADQAPRRSPSPHTGARRKKATEKTRAPVAWRELFGTPAAEQFLRVHLFEGVRWFSKEALELMLSCLALVQNLDGEPRLEVDPILLSAAQSGYRWSELMALLGAPPT
jgi:hypothetical protein